MTNKDKLIADAFNADRRAALPTMDKATIDAFYEKWYGVSLTANIAQRNPAGTEENRDLMFWGGVHKAFTGDAGLPIEMRRASKRWLLERGLTPKDDGNL